MTKPPYDAFVGHYGMDASRNKSPAQRPTRTGRWNPKPAT